MAEQIRVVFTDLEEYKDLLKKHEDLTESKLHTDVNLSSIGNALSGLNGKFASLSSSFSSACNSTQSSITSYITYLNDLDSKLSTYIDKQKKINS